MATAPSMAPDVRKMSFAKVAASRAKDTPPAVTASARAPNPTSTKDRRNHIPALTPSPGVAGGAPASTQTVAAPATKNSDASGNGDGVMESQLVEGLRGLKIETKTPNLVVNGTGSTITERSSKTGNSQTPSEDNSQRADSNSELGTKPPSLDGKSITSGTTFALDEKESLRPDDSASVKAAAEDDDAFSIRGSLIAPGSRMGSEVAVRFHRLQIGDMPPRTITTHVPLGLNSQGVATPPSSSSDKPPIIDSKLPLVAGTATPDGLSGNMFYRQNPDEKLLEAMQSPKDRLFLLRLEAQVISFVQDSKEPFMDLPPCNSFCRMLTHKLADYYHMTHSFEAAAGEGAVRIYRTPFCRVPPPLSGIVVNPSSSSSPVPAVLPRKIMRRGQDGEFATTSGSPSKPTSEAGSDSKEKTAEQKVKLTREEREENYKQARERIFGEKTASSQTENDDGNGLSRASSVSAKDKSAVSKRKTGRQRRDDSESFDSRSQYIPWCGPQQPNWATPQYIPINNTQMFNAFPQPYPTALQPIYGPNQSYPQQMVPNNGFMPPYHAVPATYTAQPMPQPTPPPRYQHQSPPVQGYGPPIPSVPPQQGWQQPAMSSHSPYQARAALATGPVGAANGVPYAYGQLPVNIDPNDPKSQHPIPGSYNRNGFNPKTQSFVPGGGIPPMPAPPVPYAGPSPHHGSPQFSSPHVGYNAHSYQQQQMLPQPVFAGNGASYGMVRQGSNTSLPPYHQPPAPHHAVQVSQQHLSHGLPHGPIHHSLPPNPTIQHNIPNKPVMSQGGGPVQGYGSLPNYGNPASLPQKPM